MRFIAVFLLIASAASLAACGKSEEAAAPAPQTPVAEAPPAAPVAAAPAETVAPAAEPAVEPAAAEAPAQPAAAPAPAAAPVAKATQPVPASVPTAPAPSEPAAAPPAAPASDLVLGKKIYQQACAFCHDRGVAGAPKTGDKAVWTMRMAQGMDTLYTVALRGKGAMPAKGGNPSLSETDVKAAVDYMIAQSR